MADLQADLSVLGQPLTIRVGEALPVLQSLLERLPVAAVWPHEETGNGWTYARDLAVADLLRARGLPWHELPQNGVVRRLASRDRWSRTWERRMALPLESPPRLTPLRLDPGIGGLGGIPSATDLGIAADQCPGRQGGGRRQAERVLESFLTGRGQRYHKEMSSPLTAFDSCSRLSAHLAYGTLSMREVVQATRLGRAQVKALGGRDGWAGPLLLRRLSAQARVRRIGAASR